MSTETNGATAPRGAFDLGAVMAQQAIEDAGKWFPIDPGGEVFIRFLGDDGWRAAIARREHAYRKQHPKLKPQQEIPREDWIKIQNSEFVERKLGDWRGFQIGVDQKEAFGTLLDFGNEYDGPNGRVVDLPFTKRNALYMVSTVRTFRDQVYTLSGTQEAFAEERLAEEADFSGGNSGGAPGISG